MRSDHPSRQIQKKTCRSAQNHDQNRVPFEPAQNEKGCDKGTKTEPIYIVKTCCSAVKGDEIQD